MQPGMIGLGRMGANQTRHLMRDGHEVDVGDELLSAMGNESDGHVEKAAAGAR
jgi:6-phosphogluconate dehydrogenase (decarboxylating)